MMKAHPLILFLLASLAIPVASAADISLTEAEQAALNGNREIRQAHLASERARADVEAAGESPNPQLSVWAGPTAVGRLGPGPLWDKLDTSFRIDQVIERGGKKDLRVAAAEGIQAAGQHDEESVRRQQLAAVRSAWYGLLSAQQRLAVLNDTAELVRRTLGTAEKRLGAGDLAASEVARVRVEAERAAVEAHRAENDRQRAQLALAYAMGAAAGDLVAAGDWPAAAARRTGDIDSRPDVQAAAARHLAAERRLELARSLRVRDVTISGQVEANSSNFSPPTTAYGIGFSVPLFVNHTYEGEIRQAAVDLDAAEDNLNLVRARADTELRMAAGDFDTALDRLKAYDGGILQEAAKAAAAAEFAFAHGAIGVTDLLDARRTLKATQLDALAARLDYAVARAAWLAAGGELQS